MQLTQENINREGAYKKMHDFLKFLRSFQINNFDCMIPVSSPKGFGKSTTCIQLAKRFMEKYHDKDFSFNRNVAYSNADVTEKLGKMEKYEVLVCDEALDFAQASDWNKRESKQLKKIFGKIRTKHLIVFFAIPNFWWLDAKYRETFSTFRLHQIDRGYVIVYRPNLADGIVDRWDKKFFENVRFHSYGSKLNQALRTYRKHPSYYGEFAIPKLPDPLYENYQKVRDQNIFDNEDETDSSSLACLAFNLNKHHNFTQKEIAEAMKPTTVHPATISRWIKKVQEKYKK